MRTRMLVQGTRSDAWLIIFDLLAKRAKRCARLCYPGSFILSPANIRRSTREKREPWACPLGNLLHLPCARARPQTCRPMGTRCNDKHLSLSCLRRKNTPFEGGGYPLGPGAPTPRLELLSIPCSPYFVARNLPCAYIAIHRYVLSSTRLMCFDKRAVLNCFRRVICSLPVTVRRTYMASRFATRFGRARLREPTNCQGVEMHPLAQFPVPHHLPPTRHAILGKVASLPTSEMARFIAADLA